jgi:hypothetical protein
MKITSTIIFTLFFAITASVSFANNSADQIYKGYVVLTSGEKVEGEVEFINPTLNEEVVIFYKDGKKTKYNAAKGEITEYGFLFQRHNKFTKKMEPYWFTYVLKSIPDGDKTVFMQREVEGKITLYSYYTLETSGINERSYKHNYFVEKAGSNELTRIDRNNYREAVKTYIVSGNKDLEMNLGHVGFGYKYLSNLVSLQNAWLGGDAMYYSMLEAEGLDAGGYADTTDDK